MQVPVTSTLALGHLAKAARMAQKLTAGVVATATGLSEDFITDVEAGKETVRIGKVLTLLNELGIVLVADAEGVDILLAEVQSGKKKRLRK